MEVPQEANALTVNKIKSLVQGLSELEKTAIVAKLQGDEFSFSVEAKLHEPTQTEDTEAICNLLFEWSQSDSISQRRFVLSFVPSLLYLYLANLNASTTPAGITAILLALYNSEMDRKRSQRQQQQQHSRGAPRIPNISVSSVYHSAKQLGVVSPLTANALLMLNSSGESDPRSAGGFAPLPSSASAAATEINGENREEVLAVVTRAFVSNLSALPLRVAQNFYIVVERLAGSGRSIVPSPGSTSASKPPGDFSGLTTTFSGVEGDSKHPPQSPSRVVHRDLEVMLEAMERWFSEIEHRVPLGRRLAKEILNGLNYRDGVDSENLTGQSLALKELADSALRSLHMRALQEFWTDVHVLTRSALSLHVGVIPEDSALIMHSILPKKSSSRHVV